MEMVHQPYTNFYSNYSNSYSSSYGNFNHQNDKSFQFGNSYENRTYKSNKSSLDGRFTFSNLIKNNFKNDSSNPDSDRNEYIEFKSGMQDVPAWLKSLRLHKYKLIFSELTYEEMLGLTEQQLEEKNVTKGARHKIIVNIDKLRARQSNVISMEKSIDQEGVSGIKQSLNELKSMLITPIKAFELIQDKDCQTKNEDDIAEGDLPSQIMKLFEKIFPYFQKDVITDDEIVNLFLNNVAKCLNHEAFTASQKQRLIQLETRIETKYCDPVLKYTTGYKTVKERHWNPVKKSMMFKGQNYLQNQTYKNISNNSLNSNHSSNGYETNGLNDQYNTNSSMTGSNQHFHHPYQNSSKFNSSSYSSSSLNNSEQNIFTKNNHMKHSNLNNLISSNHSNSLNKNQKFSTNFSLSKSNENQFKHTFNVNAESFTSSKGTTNESLNNCKNSKISSILSNETRRKLIENRFSFGDSKFSEVFSEYDDNQNVNSNQNNQNDSNKIISPLSSCSLFNACSQIGKFNKINHLNSFDKLSSLESNLKQNNQFIFNTLINENALMKCLENNSTLANSNVFSHQKLESNYETEDFDDKSDENHQIYSHIELLSLRMTEQALGNSEFS